MTEDLTGLVGDEPIPKVVFILKIQIEGTLGHTGSFHNVRNGGFGKPLGGEQVKCGV
jgi:hypothetical protein